MAEITLTKTTIRPSTDVEWYKTPESVLDYINSTYRFGKGQLLKTEFILSEDGLTLTMINTWSSPEDHAAFMADPIVAANMAAMKSYNVQHNIAANFGIISPNGLNNSATGPDGFLENHK